MTLCSSTRQRQICLSLFTRFCCVVLLAFRLLTLPVFSFGDATPPYVPGEVLLGIKDESDDETVPKLLSTVGTVLWHNPETHYYRLKLVDGLSVESAIALLLKLPQVKYAEPNGYVHMASIPNDTYYNTAYTSGYPAQYGPKTTRANFAWSIWEPRQQIIIAILDSGVDGSHSDLTNKMLRDNASSIIGYEPAVYPYANAANYTNNDPPYSNASDAHGHGTHVAGIAAAQTNNSTGIAGIAGWTGVTGQTNTAAIKVMPVRVLPDIYTNPTNNTKEASGTAQEIVDGIHWARIHHANVINMSLTTTLNKVPHQYSSISSEITDAWNKGCIIVAAAGNDGTSTYQYPAHDNYVISVGATDSTDKLAGFSTYGSWVNVAAPGGQGATLAAADLVHSEGILSTTPTYSVPGASQNYDYFWGTSQACPHVAGEAALIWAQNPYLTNVQVNALLTGFADPVTSYVDSSNTTHSIGGKRVNIYEALRQVSGAQIAPDTNADGFADLIYQYTSSNTSGISAGDIYTQPIKWTGTTYQTLFTPLDPQTKIGNANDTRTWNLVAQGDLNNDGQVDLLFQEPTTGAVKCWLMTGSTRYEVVLTTTGSSHARLVGVADLNRDGLLDLIYQYDSTGTTDKGKVTYSLINLNSSSLPYTNGGGTLYNGSSTTFLNLVGIADVNDDTYPDLVLQNPANGAVTDYLLSYNTTSGPYAYAYGTLYSGGNSNAVVISVCDLTNTGYAGLLYKNIAVGSSVNAVTFQAYNSLGTTGSPLTLYTGGNANVNVVSVTDLNRDGSFDIVYQ